MANTYTQLYFHVIFVVKGRTNPIPSAWKIELYKYTAGIVNNKFQKLLAMNGMPDYVHLLLSLRPNACLSDIVRDIKANSSRFMKEKNWHRKFEWQIGFAAFTVGYSQLNSVKTYIQNQEEHHRKKSFRKEYVNFLKQSGIECKEAYLLDEIV